MIAHFCSRCREMVDEAICPFCDNPARPIDEITPYGAMCRKPKLCAELGYCPRDPSCGD